MLHSTVHVVYGQGTFQDLPAPVADHLELQRRIDALNVLQEGTSRDPLGNEADLSGSACTEFMELGERQKNS